MCGVLLWCRAVVLCTTWYCVTLMSDEWWTVKLWRHQISQLIHFLILQEVEPIRYKVVRSKCIDSNESYLSLWLYSPLLGLGRFFSFLIFYKVGRTPWMGCDPIARPLPTHRTTQIQNKRRQTCMPWVGFEPTIPALVRAKTIHALDHVATVIGCAMSLKRHCSNLRFVMELRWVDMNQN
jgi:hypothetical protein